MLVARKPIQFTQLTYLSNVISEFHTLWNPHWHIKC